MGLKTAELQYYDGANWITLQKRQATGATLMAESFFWGAPPATATNYRILCTDDDGISVGTTSLTSISLSR